MTPQTQTKAFLFVNKDSKSKFLSRGDDKQHEIGKHVQKWRQEKKHIALRVHPGSAIKVARSGWSKVQSSSQNCASRPSISPESLEKWPVEVDQKSTILSTNTVAGSCVDPFDCIPINLTSEVQQILQYFLRYTITASHNYRLELLPPQLRQHRHRFALNLGVKRCLFDKRHMFSLLTVAAARMKIVSGVQLAPTSSSEYFMAIAIPYLRDHLLAASSPTGVDSQTIFDIYWLAVSELYTANLAGVESHLKILAQLARFLNLADPFDDQLFESINVLDVLLSIETGRLPSLPLTWRPPSVPAERFNQIQAEVTQMCLQGSSPHSSVSSPDITAAQATDAIVLAPPSPGESLNSASIMVNMRMGHAFEQMLLQISLPQGFLTIVHDILHAVDVAKFIMFSEKATKAEAEWLCKEGYAATHRLLSLSSDNATPTDDRFSEAVRLSFIVMMSFILTRLTWRTGQLNAARLRQAILGIRNERPYHNEEHKGVLLWMYATGALAANDDSEDESWFMQEGAWMAVLLDLRTCHEICNHLSRYLFLPALQERHVRKISRFIKEQVYLS